MEFHIPSLKDILTNGLKPEASARPRKNRETSKPNIDPFALRYFGIIYSIQGASEPGEKIRSLGRGSSGTNAGHGSAPILEREDHGPEGGSRDRSRSRRSGASTNRETPLSGPAAGISCRAGSLGGALRARSGKTRRSRAWGFWPCRPDGRKSRWFLPRLRKCLQSSRPGRRGRGTSGEPEEGRRDWALRRPALAVRRRFGSDRLRFSCPEYIRVRNGRQPEIEHHFLGPMGVKPGEGAGRHQAHDKQDYF